jgi:hypothetical protein
MGALRRRRCGQGRVDGVLDVLVGAGKRRRHERRAAVTAAQTGGAVVVRRHHCADARDRGEPAGDVLDGGSEGGIRGADAFPALHEDLLLGLLGEAASSTARSATFDWPLPSSTSSSCFVPTAPPSTVAMMIRANHPKIAFLRFAALQAPMRAAMPRG